MRSLSTHGGTTGNLSSDEIERLQIQQIAHREAIYKGNSVGRFGKNKNLDFLEKQMAAYRRSLPPSERAKLRHDLPNRPATGEEIALAAQSHRKYERHVHDKKKEYEDAQAALRKLQELGYDTSQIQRTPSKAPPPYPGNGDATSSSVGQYYAPVYGNGASNRPEGYVELTSVERAEHKSPVVVPHDTSAPHNSHSHHHHHHAHHTHSNYSDSSGDARSDEGGKDKEKEKEKKKSKKHSHADKDKVKDKGSHKSSHKKKKSHKSSSSSALPGAASDSHSQLYNAEPSMSVQAPSLHQSDVRPLLS